MFVKEIRVLMFLIFFKLSVAFIASRDDFSTEFGCVVGETFNANLKLYNYFNSSSKIQLQEISFTVPDNFEKKEFSLIKNYKIQDARGIEVVGDFAYVAQGVNGISKISIANPSSPSHLNALSTIGEANKVKIVNNTAFIVSSPKARIEIIDVASFSHLGSAQFDGTGYGISIAKDNITAFISAWGNGVRMIDVSDLNNPTQLVRSDTSGHTQNTVVLSNSNIVFFADYDNGFLISTYDPQAQSIKRMKKIGGLGNVKTLAIFEDSEYAYVIAATSSGLHVINSTIPVEDDIQLIQSIETIGGEESITLDENFLYSLSTRGLSIYEINKEGNSFYIEFVGEYLFPSSESFTPSDIVVDKDKIYTTDEEQGLLIFQMLDPNNIEISGPCASTTPLDFSIHVQNVSVNFTIIGKCKENYFGEFCDIVKCFNIPSNESNVCNGDGNLCISTNNCSCSSNGVSFESDTWKYLSDCSVVCKDKNLAIGETCYSEVIVFGGIIVGSCIIIFILLLLFIALFVIFILCFRSRKFEKFKKIKNIDIILKEAELEELEESKNEKLVNLTIKEKNYIVDQKDITLKSVIGRSGNDSVIYLANWKGRECAFKSFIVRSFGDTTESITEFEKEVSVFINVNHPSILQFYGASISLPKIGLLLEYCSLGDIPSFFLFYAEKNQEDYPISEKLRLLKEIISGMVYLHSLKFMHRDMKPENVLINGEEKAKIMDFGLSKMKDRIDQTMTKQIGTSFYMAPEVITSGKYGFSSDVYSFSMLMFAVITSNFTPFGKDVNEAFIMKNVGSDPDFRPKINKKDFNECEFLIPIIIKNWSNEKNERNTFEELLRIFNQKNI